MGNLSTIQTVDVCTIKKVMQLLSMSKSTAGRYISLCRDILHLLVVAYLWLDFHKSILFPNRTGILSVSPASRQN